MVKLPDETDQTKNVECKFHAEITETELNYMGVGERQIMLKTEFPPPPLPGTSDILPISTPQMLLEESDQMHNFVLPLHGDIQSGDCYFYRMIAPTRATLLLSRTAAGGIEPKDSTGVIASGAGPMALGAVSGPNGQTAPLSAWNAARAWLTASVVCSKK